MRFVKFCSSKDPFDPGTVVGYQLKVYVRAKVHTLPQSMG